MQPPPPPPPRPPREDTIASEVLSAALGGAISSAALYPLEVLKTRMQAAAGDANAEEGSGGAAAVASFVDDDGRGGERRNRENEGDGFDDAGGGDSNGNGKTVVATAGEGGSVRRRRNTAFGFAAELCRREGPRVFFRGMEVSALRSAVEKACYFFAYAALKRAYQTAAAAKAGAAVPPRTTTAPEGGGGGSGTVRSSSSPPPPIPALANLALGCLAEWAHLPLTLPVDALATAIQTSSSRSGGRSDDTALELLLTMWRGGSVYRGVQTYYVLCLKPALQYTIFERVRAWILAGRRQPPSAAAEQQRQRQHLSALEAFALGMFSRMVATLVVYPFVRAKVQLQCSRSGSGCDSGTGSTGDGGTPPPTTTPPTSVWDLLAASYATGGVATLYRGLGPELTRGVLSAALMMMVKERISGGVKGALDRGQ